MKKNIVFLVVDSLMSDRMFSNEYGLSTTPFLDSIKNQCVIARNVYAQGPFTEAGTKGLLTGRDTLDDEGYFLRYHKSKTFITNIFKDAGYQTHSLIYPTCLYSDWIFDKLDGIYYTSEMLYDVFWEQKFKHYIEYKKNNKLDKRDIQDCIELFDVIFVAWLKFLNPDSEKERVLLEPFDRDFNYSEKFNILSNEYERFKRDKEGYVDEYLNVAPAHPINNIKSEITANFICNEAINGAFALHKKFEKRLVQKQFFYNLKNNRLTLQCLKSMMESLKKVIDKQTFGEAVYWLKTLTRGKDVWRYKKGKDYKQLLSARTQLKHIENLLNTDTNVPKFITAHLEEPHYFTTFFSYDSGDENLISAELDYADEYVKSLKGNYRGLISYDLAIRYIDRQIEDFVDDLEKTGELDNTIICIVADHGSSYNCYPYRHRIVNNCHTENFKIPFIIYEKGSVKREISHIATSKDVIPTILDYIGEEVPMEITGESLLNANCDKKFAITEYMGPGCPDMRRNKACITIRNRRYLIAFESNLKEAFNEHNITEIYDLSVDKLEMCNIKSVRNEQINEMISALNKRYDEICVDNNIWINS